MCVSAHTIHTTNPKLNPNFTKPKLKPNAYTIHTQKDTTISTRIRIHSHIPIHILIHTNVHTRPRANPHPYAHPYAPIPPIHIKTHTESSSIIGIPVMFANKLAPVHNVSKENSVKEVN